MKNCDGNRVCASCMKREENLSTILKLHKRPQHHKGTKQNYWSCASRKKNYQLQALFEQFIDVEVTLTFVGHLKS